jgi:hypothetical protein
MGLGSKPWRHGRHEFVPAGPCVVVGSMGLGSKLELELGNKLVLELGNKLVLELGSKLELELGSKLELELGSKLVLELGSTLARSKKISSCSRTNQLQLEEQQRC